VDIPVTGVGGALRIMSFNVRYGTAEDGEDSWRHRRSSAIKIVQEFAPDVAGLQEALDFQVDEFLAAMPGYESIGVGRDDGGRRGEFAPLLYKISRLIPLEGGTFWLSATPLEPGSRHPGCYHPRICVWSRFQDRQSGKSFLTCNLHLDNESAQARREGVELVLRAINGNAAFMRAERKGPAIVLGDFNAGEQDPCVEAMRAAGFRDTFRVVHPAISDVATYHGFGEGSNSDKIDYVWVDTQWIAVDATIVRDRIDGKWPSDHYPVTALIRND